VSRSDFTTYGCRLQTHARCCFVYTMTIKGKPRYNVRGMVSHILIVDSDTIAADVTRAIVSRAVPEATVTIAPVAEHGALNMQGNFPDVLIIDPSPHAVHGARLIRQIKAARADARVIVIASAPTPASRRTIAELQVDAYLEKPVLLSLFMDQLRVLLRNDAAFGHTELVLTHSPE
jgi:DNA-binding NarL/FixJ family response regulator